MCIVNYAGINTSVARNEMGIGVLKWKRSDHCYPYIKTYVKHLPSAQPEWNNHTVACLLADMFGDTCACNYNGIDEWLPGKCELLDSCPHPVGVACWEQFLKHKAERRTDG